MENELYIINQNIEGFIEGEIVLAFNTQPYKNKKAITNYKVIGKWSCCGCNKYKQEIIENKYLIYLDKI